MAEFEKAFTVESLAGFISGRVQKLIAYSRRADGDAFLLRQSRYYRRAYLDCKCDSHTCFGCQITGAVGAQLGTLADDADIHPNRAEFELGRADAIWDRVNREYWAKVQEIRERHLALEQAKKRPDPRAESIRREQEADNAA